MTDKTFRELVFRRLSEIDETKKTPAEMEGLPGVLSLIVLIEMIDGGKMELEDFIARVNARLDILNSGDHSWN